MDKFDRKAAERDFNYWSELYRRNPDEFEKKRKERMEKKIKKIVRVGNLSDRREARLRGLQWRIDMIHKRYADNPIGGCVKISLMMWDSFYNLSNNLKKFDFKIK